MLFPITPITLKPPLLIPSMQLIYIVSLSLLQYSSHLTYRDGPSLKKLSLH